MHIKDIFIFLFSIYAFLWGCIIALTLYAGLCIRLKGTLNGD